MHFKACLATLTLVFGAFVVRADSRCADVVAKLHYDHKQDLFASLSQISWDRQFRFDMVWNPPDSAREIAEVFFEDQAYLFDTPTIWTEEQQKRVAKIISEKNLMINGTYNNEVNYSGKNYARRMKFRFGEDVSQALENRLTSVMAAINKNLKDWQKFRLHSVSIHLQNARSFTSFHRHGEGDITIAFSEVGYVTEVEGIPTNQYKQGGQTAVISDGVLHRPNILNDSLSGPLTKLIVFAQLTPLRLISPAR